MPTPMRAAALLITCTAALAACAGSTSSAPPASATISPTASSAAAAATAASTPTAASPGTVSANTATTDELVAALEAAGVPNADRWAREIEEYRPYDVADPTLKHLQDELAKYDPDPATLAAILGALQP